MFRALIYQLRKLKIIFIQIILKLFYCDHRFQIGRNLRASSIPKITITDNAKVKIGENVIIREGVEIRAHKNSSLEIGNNCRIDRGVRILSTNESNIKIADGTRIGLYSVLNGGDSITIGGKTLISGFVYLQTSMHKFDKADSSIQDQGYTHAPIILESDVWIGTHAVIFPGIHIGHGAIIGSNAVVNKNVLNGQIVGGVPAKEINMRT